MNIKKADDKSMDIHIKAGIRIHRHEPKSTAIKGGVYAAGQNPGKNGSMPAEKKKSGKDVSYGAKDSGRKNYRGRTHHPAGTEQKRKIITYRGNVKGTGPSIKVRNISLKNAGMAGTKAMTDQMEGGEEFRQSAMILQEAGRPVTGAASKGAELFKKQAMEQKKRNIRKVETAKRLVKKGAQKAVKDTAKRITKGTAKETGKIMAKVAVKAAASAAGTAAAPGVGTAIGYAAGEAVGAGIEHNDMVMDNRARKIKFLLDKLKAEEKQTDSVAKLIRDLVLRRAGMAARQMAAKAAPIILLLFFLVFIVTVPTAAVVGTAYNSPFAVFFPSLEGESATAVAVSYVEDFNREVRTLAREHTGYDAGKIVYAGYEGTDAAPSNYYDILAVYMVRYGTGDTAAIMNDLSKSRLRAVVNDMCSYTVSSGTETKTMTNEDGTKTDITTSYLCVNVFLKTWRDMISSYGFGSREQELLAEFMKPESLVMLGYSPDSSGGETGGGGGTMQSALSEEEIWNILAGIRDSAQRAACGYALYRTGYPYSQAMRDSGKYYDCSSLAYYSWKAAGKDISYGGATTAAAEAQGLHEAGKAVAFDSMQPGDLIFYSTSKNGRYMDITHVAVYVGNGKVVEALNEKYGVVYQDVRTRNIVLVCRP